MTKRHKHSSSNGHTSKRRSASAAATGEEVVGGGAVVRKSSSRHRSKSSSASNNNNGGWSQKVATLLTGPAGTSFILCCAAALILLLLLNREKEVMDVALSGNDDGVSSTSALFRPSVVTVKGNGAVASVRSDRQEGDDEDKDDENDDEEEEEEEEEDFNSRTRNSDGDSQDDEDEDERIKQRFDPLPPARINQIPKEQGDIQLNFANNPRYRGPVEEEEDKEESKAMGMAAVGRGEGRGRGGRQPPNVRVGANPRAGGTDRRGRNSAAPNGNGSNRMDASQIQVVAGTVNLDLPADTGLGKSSEMPFYHCGPTYYGSHPASGPELILLHGAKFTKEEWFSTGAMAHLCSLGQLGGLSVTALDLGTQATASDLGAAIRALAAGGSPQAEVLSGNALFVVTPSASGRAVVGLADMAVAVGGGSTRAGLRLLRGTLRGWIPIAPYSVLRATREALQTFGDAGVPIQPIHGRDDVRGRQVSKRLESKSNALPLLELKGGHACYLEDSTAEFVDAVIRFIRIVMENEKNAASQKTKRP